MKDRQPPRDRYVDDERHDPKKYPKWRMEWQERDGRILDHIHAYSGFLSQDQIQRLEFGESKTIRAVQERLGKLFHNGYVARTSREGSSFCRASIYWLSPKGAEVVAGRSGETMKDFTYLKKPPWSIVTHDLLVVDFTMIMQAACFTSGGLVLAEWVNERTMRADAPRVLYTSQNGNKRTREIVPDSIYAIVRKSQNFRSRLLLELDNDTHSDSAFVDKKVLPGLAYIDSEMYQQRFRGPEDNDKKIGGRWIVLTRSMQRLAYLRDATARAAGRNAKGWYFTTFEQVQMEALFNQPIWYTGDGGDPKVLFD